MITKCIPVPQFCGDYDLNLSEISCNSVAYYDSCLATALTKQIKLTILQQPR